MCVFVKRRYSKKVWIVSVFRAERLGNLIQSAGALCDLLQVLARQQVFGRHGAVNAQILGISDLARLAERLDLLLGHQLTKRGALRDGSQHQLALLGVLCHITVGNALLGHGVAHVLAVYHDGRRLHTGITTDGDGVQLGYKVVALLAAALQHLDNNLLTALQAYMTGDREAAIAALGSVDLSNTELSESARACAQTVVDNCADLLDPYRSAGMTAFSAENYAEAITQLKVYCNLKPDDVEARYNLASAYKSTGDLASANALFDDINKRFPDSEYANRDENASTGSDTSGSTESGTEAGGTTSTEHTMPEE